jgi:hypothetical protein
LKWFYNGKSGIELPNYADGAAGVGYFFVTLHYFTGDIKWLNVCHISPLISVMVSASFIPFTHLLTLNIFWSLRTIGSQTSSCLSFGYCE